MSFYVSFPIAGAPNSTPSWQDYTNTFLLSSTSNAEPTLVEVPKALNIDPARKRRAHKKSNTGCENCRRRRVKCSVETPCASCTHRREKCQRLKRSPSFSIMRTETPLPRPTTIDASVNLVHMKLFHHFQTYTRETLLFTPVVWGHALQLCLEFEFLMDAVLCIAARHLAALRPEDPTYPTAAASHFGRCLSQFRHALSNNLTSTHIDAFVATSLLLQYELWADVDLCAPEMNAGDASFDDSMNDRMFIFCSSLKQVFLKNITLTYGTSSVFMPQVRHDPRDLLVEKPINTEFLKLSFLYTRSTELANSNPWKHNASRIQENAFDTVEDVYTPIIIQLCLILSFLPEAQPPSLANAKSPLLPELARFILSFPLVCHGSFATLVQQREPRALLLLYHFYRAARILLPFEKYWWAHKRATVSEIALKQWLTRKSAKVAV
ncbi:hypothetical protein BGW36DRAFT_420724 [Talaromyces proteolyticus]|uniref:Zn(2)-C6 fungal-type domain-containing protein n=1 Tax=Talaromyces proteolyticus TaxID=1131652 RepID=A0AAD4PUH5_9EURO|nr:uncharacterized protein BGW36DRAFT_420724 [Talaromyces proteolyticus]KAH8689385.1 hypothetical protein BGW36DRAFT_420724 [Talaromyces proteolyticus]